MDRFLSKIDTLMMKGIAILLMLAHHLWLFPERIPGGMLRYHFTIFGIPSITYIGGFGKICVSLFFFLGGYGLYINSSGKNFDVIKRIKHLYLSYWKVLLIFIPIGFLVFDNQGIYCEKATICTKYSQFYIEDFLNNFLGISNSYNSEWWFLRSYVVSIILFPFVRGIITRFSAKNNIALVIVSSIIMGNMLPAIGKLDVLGNLENNPLYSNFLKQTYPYITCFWMGIVAACNGLLDRIKDSYKKNHVDTTIFHFGIMMSIVFLRQNSLGNNFDFIYVPFLTVSVIELTNRTNIIRKMLIEFGKQSTNMWLIHSFLCYYFGTTAKFITAPRFAIISLLILVEMTYLSSLSVDLIWKRISITYSKILSRIGGG